MAGPGNILIRIGAETGQAVRELGRVDKALGGTMTAGQKATAGLKKAAVPAAAALAGVGYAAIDATKAAIDDAAASEKLAGQLHRVAGANDATVKAAEDYISKLTLQTGIADDELRPALGKLAGATHDVAKGQKLLALATDISAQSGEDLDTVSDALAKGYVGQTRSLAKLVPGLDKATLASKDMNKITADLAKLTGGAAQEAAGTAAGQYQVFTNSLNETKESIGYGLIPVVQAFLPLLQKTSTWAAENTGVVKVLAGAVAVLAGGILAANAAIKIYSALQIATKAATAAWTAAQWLLNAALTANPIGLVTVALVALGAALVVAYKKSETFRDIVHGALSAVRDAAAALDRAFDALRASASSAFDWIIAHWKLALFTFGPIGAAIYVLAENFDKVKAAGTGAFRAITAAIHWAIEGIKNLIDWLGKIHIPKLSLPHIPGLNVASTFAPVPSTRTAAAAAAGGGGVTVNVYGAVDPEGTARAIRRTLVAHDRRQGRIV